MACGGAGLDGVPEAGQPEWFCQPAGGFLGVVAGFAKPLAISRDSGSSFCPAENVVVVPDGCITIRRPAGVVPDLKKPSEPGREKPRPGVHRHELARPGCGVEPADPEDQVLPVMGFGTGTFGVEEEGAGGFGGHDAVTGILAGSLSPWNRDRSVITT